MRTSEHKRMITTGVAIVIGIVFLFQNSLQAQSETDSLLRALAKSAEDSNKVILLNDLAHAYYNQDKEKSRRFSQEALTFSRQIHYLRGEAMVTSNVAWYVQKDGHYDSAIALQNRAMVLYKRLNDKEGIAKSLSDISTAYWRKSDFPKALEFQLRALKLYESMNDIKGIAFGYNVLGLIYKSLEKEEEALKYYLKSIALRKQLQDDRGLAAAYLNIASIYKNRLKEDTAMQYYMAAIVLYKKTGNIRGESLGARGLGDLKFKFGKFAEARQYYMQSVELGKTVIDSNDLASTYLSIGNTSASMKEYESAGVYIRQGLAILEKLGDKDGIMEAYEMLASLSRNVGDYEGSLKYTHAYYQLRDTITGIKEREKMAELQVQYEVERKDLELARNKAELATKAKEAIVKNVVIVSIVVLVLLLAAVGYLFYNKKRLEQKARHDAELLMQKDLRTKSVIEAEEKERIRIARDLHDGIGQLLSAAKLNLSSLDGKVELRNEEQRGALKNAVDLLDESVKEVRSVSHNMMPNILLKSGLASAIRDFVTKIQNMPQLKVNLEIVGMQERLPAEKESVLYRVIQELVTNIIKHAKADEISVQVIRHDNELSVVIEDNGIGFNAARINDFGGIGLKNVVSRVEFINGTVHFDSLQGRGTTVIIAVPLSA